MDTVTTMFGETVPASALDHDQPRASLRGQPLGIKLSSSLFHNKLRITRLVQTHQADPESLREIAAKVRFLRVSWTRKAPEQVPALIAHFEGLLKRVAKGKLPCPKQSS